MDSIIVEKIKKEIENFAPETTTERVGIVSKVGDGIVEIEGLNDARMSEMVVFDDTDNKSLEELLERKDNVTGLILNLEEEVVRAVVLGDSARVREGMRVHGTKHVLSVGVGDELIGRVIDSLGTPLDGKGAISTNSTKELESTGYGVIDRAPVDTPVHTGIKAIDAMVPIGRGQRELIIGDRFTGKTTIALDTIINQKNEPKESRPICIYVAIGQKESKTARIVAELAKRGAMEYTIIISSSAASPAALQFLAPFTGATIGEYFMEKGRDAIVVFDDLSKHAVAYRQMSLLLRRPPGREAYPGDIFYLHSRLLERSAKLSKEKGGGSLTALPIIETQEGDVSAYIPTNVISITDGQIFLDTDLFNKGMLPAINVGLSVSRVGSHAQTKAMKKVASRIRLQLAQFRELEAFMQFSQDLDETTKRRIDEGQRLAESLKQGKYVPIPFERQIVMIYSAVNGGLEKVPVSKVGEYEEKLFVFIDTHHADIFETIKSEKDISQATEKNIKEMLTKFEAAEKELFSTE
ncbi:F0F1 ATP synthase subunit alpha [Patescibacteria group bacterium]|nr:F0F1 ATP synthase subunit alpha [Patescibacteria group bacterium]